MIPQSFIEDVQQRNDIVDLISGYVPLKKAGRNFKACCPFHNEKTPSFIVSPQKQIFHCFGCGEGGGAIQFLMLYDKLNFIEAVEVLAKRAGLRMPQAQLTRQDKMRFRLYEVNASAADFFHKNLKLLPKTHPAHEFLRSRKITPETVDTFKIGFAPGLDKLTQYMRNKGYTLETLEKASLIVPRRGGGFRDLFIKRIIFPIYDIRNRVIAFGGRAIEDRKGVPKYMNSLENSLYSKRNHLYGLNFSKDSIMKKDSVIVSEGYLDMITPFCCGIDNIVASLGTALTPRQISLIKRYTDNIILVFDADSAGETATIRALDLVLENGLRPEVLSMPEGFDLDAAVRQKGKDYLMHLLEGKQNFFDYKLSILTKHYSKEKIQDRVKIAQRMLASIRKIPDKIERDEYVKLLSAALKIKEATLLAELKDEQRSQRQLMPQLDQQETIPIVERLIFKFIFTNKKVYDFISQNINESDFANSLSRKTYSLINAKNQEQGYLGYREFLSLVQDRNINSFLSQIILEDTGDLNKTVLQDCVEKLQKRRIKLLKNELREKIKKAEKNKSIEEVKKLMKEYKKINSEVLHG